MVRERMPHSEGQGNGAMSSEEVYQKTTEPIEDTGNFCNLKYLITGRGPLKTVQLVLSLVAFVLEEVVENCMNCHALYFFEFVSCSAFFLTLFLLIILATSLKKKVIQINWIQVDLWYTAVIAILFLIASIVFAAKNDGTDVEKASVAFGFLASFAFIIDAALQCKEKGILYTKKDAKPAEPKKDLENVKGETEPLNEQGNATA
ncbi:CKLF-like MARVEL transmembrane domain-containing protein 6 [Heptranchias perlo]|uniref:CKLF-like MARVEL transmembrane domain-containing protein 6 n=1 Tax=Heptranchias perlo TaxID=212740 RepID=UPI00355A35BC